MSVFSMIHDSNARVFAPATRLSEVRSRQAFTLLEIFVVLGIIAMFLALLVPFVMRLREGGRSEVCVQNMKRIGMAMKAYAAEHDDRFPGPLTVQQYPADSAGNPPRDGQLLKYIATYLNAPAGGPDGDRDARNTFTFPAWQKAERTTDAPVFLVNLEPAQPNGAPVWGAEGTPAMKFADLKNWKRKVRGKEEVADPAKVWALTEADQELTKLLRINEPWVGMIPQKPVHVSHRNALYFDLHVEPLVLSRSVSELQ